MFTTPVLILFFNRYTVFDVLKQVKVVQPKKLYLSCDGPRNSIEQNLVEKLRNSLLDSIDWQCSIYTQFQDENLGCKKAVHMGIQWFFSNEDRGIVLEDDIVPSINFFQFCDQCLELYKDNMSISSICGRNELEVFQAEVADIFLSSKFFCWGWASWSNRVLGLDINLSSNYDVKKKILKSTCKYESLLIEGMYGLIESNQVNSWAFEYDINFRSKDQLQILPQKNMISNIGVAIPGAHSVGGSEDSIPRFDSFLPNLSEKISLMFVENDLFINLYLKKIYGSIFKLYLFSNIKYFKFLRQLLKKMR